MRHTTRQLTAMLALLALLTYAMTKNQLWAQTSSQTQSTLENPSFESGNFTGFTTLDAVDGGPPPPPPINDVMSSSGENYSAGIYVKSHSLMLNPTDGSFFALVNTVRGAYHLRQSVLIQESFPIVMAGAKLLVDLNYMTDEVNTGRATNDIASVYITINESGEIIPIAFLSRDQLQPEGIGEPIAAALRDVGSFKLSTGWKTYYTDLSKYVGKSAFLTFNVRKAAPLLGGEAQNSALAIDNIRLVN